MPSANFDLAPFITFYSYKGGVGRSMAVLNVAALLAARGFRVLIIDFDLEAPGLTHLFGKDSKKNNDEAPAGAVELLADARANGETADLFAKKFSDIAADYTFECKIPPELKPDKSGRLYIMPAGRTDTSYATRFDDLDLADLYQQGVGRGLMLHFKKVIAACGLYDYVLVDSRTGHSDEAGICTRDLADHLMVVSGFNRQNLAGTASFLTNLRAALGSDHGKHQSPDLILSPVPIGEEDRLAKQEEEAGKEFQKAWGKKLRLDLSIPYHPRLALTEDAYVTTRTTSYLKTAYSEIEARMLESLGHRSGHLYQRASDAIKKNNGQEALAAIRRASKLRGTQVGRQPRSRWDTPWNYALDFSDDSLLLDQLLKLPEAREVIQLLAAAAGLSSALAQLGKQLHSKKAKEADIVDQALLSTPHPDADLLGSYAVFLHSAQFHSKAEIFYKAVIAADSKNALHLGNYALLLQAIGRDLGAAESLHKRAIDADPNSVHLLVNYADFLANSRKNPDAAEPLYKRAIDTEPTNYRSLGNYANFLAKIRNDPDAAEILYIRNVEADPKDSDRLGDYANFLAQNRNDPDAAKALYKRAIEADPKNSDRLGNFAVFLARNREGSAADLIYKRAIKLDPKSANLLSDYGQFLLGAGSTKQGLELLRQGWSNREPVSHGNCAELTYCLWLGTLLVGAEEQSWNRAFKFFIMAGFERHKWNFDAMLSKAMETLSVKDFRYATALADAFLNQENVASLDKLARWRKLRPLDPDQVSPDGTITDD